MKKIYQNSGFVILIFWLSLGIGCTDVDPDSLSPEQVFIKYYGTLESDRLVDMLPIFNGTTLTGYLLLGNTESNFKDEDYLLIQTDVEGNQILRRTFEFSHDYQFTDIGGNLAAGTATGGDVPSRMHLYNNDQNLAIIGTSTINIKDDDNNLDRNESFAFVVNIDLNTITNSDDGNLTGIDTVALKYFDDRNGASPVPFNTTGADILFVDNGGAPNDRFLILGSTVKGIDANDPQSILLMNVSTDFQTFDYELVKGFASDDEGHRLISLGNRNFYLATIRTTGQTGNGGLDFYIEEFDIVSGSEENAFPYGTSDDDIPENIILTGAGTGFVVVGTTKATNDQTFIYSIQSGLTSFDTTFVTLPNIEGNSGFDVIQADDGGLWVVGSVNSYVDPSINKIKQNEGVLIKTTQSIDLDLANLQYFGSEGNDAGKAIIQLADGSLVIGATIDLGSGARVMALIKTNRTGKIRD